MPSRRQSALVVLVIVACQLGLVVGAVALCCVNTEGDTRTPPGQARDLMNTAPYPWSKGYYRGYPIPWVEYHEERFGLGGRHDELVSTSVVARNWAVPACLIALAFLLPPIALGAVRRWRAVGPDSVRLIRSRTCRLRWVVTLVTATGLATALLDVLSDPGGWWSVCRVPVMHPPGRWFLYSPPPSGLYLIDPPELKWLRTQRVRVLGEDDPAVSDPDLTGQEWSEVSAKQWADRTRRTLAGMGLGLVVGCVVFRPWRRSPASDKLGAGGTSCPQC